MKKNSLLITIPEAAELLGISRSHAYDELVAKGLLPTVRIGRAVRVRPEDVEALVERLVIGEVEAP